MKQVPFGQVGGVWDLGRRRHIRITRPAPGHVVNRVTVRVEQWIDGSLYSEPAEIRVEGGSPLQAVARSFQQASIGGWMQDESVWTLTPGTSPNEILITSPEGGSVLDAIAIELDVTPLEDLALAVERRTGSGDVELSWSTAAEGFVVEQSSNLARDASWEPVGGTADVVNGRWSLRVPGGEGARFFRLRRP